MDYIITMLNFFNLGIRRFELTIELYSHKGIVSEPSPKSGAWLLIAILQVSSNSPRVSILNYLRRLQLMYYSRLLYR